MNLHTPLATKLVGGLALLLVAALGWMFVVGPETSRLSEVRLDTESTQDQNQVLAVQLAALERQRKDLAETRAVARELAAKFPPTADQPGMFEAVTAGAVDAGIGPSGVTTLAPSPPVLGGTDPATGAPVSDPAGALLARQTVSISVEGTYDQTQRLLENLEQMPRAFLVDAVTLTGSEGTYLTVITGDMFVMPPVPAPEKS